MHTLDDGDCPTCGSPAPHLYPAVQHEGELEVCTDEFHLKRTPQNKPEYRKLVLEKRLAKSARQE